MTGRTTYDGNSLMKNLLAHREHPIPTLRTIRPEVSEQLEAVFGNLVATSVQDRYQSMAEVIVELERCTGGSTTFVACKITTFKVSSHDPPLAPGIRHKEVRFQ